MPKISVNILTKNRARLLGKALASVAAQDFPDLEVILINDGSTDETLEVIKLFKYLNTQTLNHPLSLGITSSRQEALNVSRGEYVAILDDDDEWIDKDKLRKQSEYMDKHPETVLVGGAIKIQLGIKNYKLIGRPQTDAQIRKTMLLKNNFFTSTVMFRKQAAIEAGGFAKDADDFAEDYDLWLRMGEQGKMHNFPLPLAAYKLSVYNKARKRAFLQKQLRLITLHKANYPRFWGANILLKLRILL